MNFFLLAKVAERPKQRNKLSVKTYSPLICTFKRIYANNLAQINFCELCLFKATTQTRNHILFFNEIELRTKFNSECCAATGKFENQNIL